MKPTGLGAVVAALLAAPGALAEEEAARPVAIAVDPNEKPPVFGKLWPERYDYSTVVANVGEPLELGVEVSDPEGADVKVSVEGLPEGATFTSAFGRGSAAKNAVFELVQVVRAGRRFLSE